MSARVDQRVRGESTAWSPDGVWRGLTAAAAVDADAAGGRSEAAG